MITTMNEIWKPISGFENLYEVSNLGRVRTLNGKVRKQQLDKDGYPRLTLTKCGRTYTHTVHRLVANAFCNNENPSEFNQVNHKDENKTNNRAENLEWCNNDYNHAYGTCGKRAGEKTSIPVTATVIETGAIEQYRSIAEAAKYLGVRNCHISSAINGKRHSAYGRTWERKK